MIKQMSSNFNIKRRRISNARKLIPSDSLTNCLIRNQQKNPKRHLVDKNELMKDFEFYQSSRCFSNKSRFERSKISSTFKDAGNLKQISQNKSVKQNTKEEETFNVSQMENTQKKPEEGTASNPNDKAKSTKSESKSKIQLTKKKNPDVYDINKAFNTVNLKNNNATEELSENVKNTFEKDLSEESFPHFVNQNKTIPLPQTGNKILNENYEKYYHHLVEKYDYLRIKVSEYKSEKEKLTQTLNECRDDKVIYVEKLENEIKNYQMMTENCIKTSSQLTEELTLLKKEIEKYRPALQIGTSHWSSNNHAKKSDFLNAKAQTPEVKNSNMKLKYS